MPNETLSIIPIQEIVKELKTGLEEDMRNKHAEDYQLNLMHLEGVGRLAHAFADELIENPIGEIEVTKEMVYLAEVAGYLHDIEKIGGDILWHHLTSERVAKRKLEHSQLTEGQIQTVTNAVRRHQGMPYINEFPLRDLRKEGEKGPLEEDEENLEAKAYDKWVALFIAEPAVALLGKFPPPNDEVSALLYSADLLSLGITHNEGNDPRAGAFDKIVQIQLGWGSTLKEAVTAAQNSLKANVDRLQNAQPYTKEEIETMEALGFKEDEFQGRERAAKIERALGEKFGDSALKRIDSLAHLAENPPKEIVMEDTMECYYKLARLNAQNLAENTQS
jgi:hypothetical protein